MVKEFNNIWKDSSSLNKFNTILLKTCLIFKKQELQAARY